LKLVRTTAFGQIVGISEGPLWVVDSTGCDRQKTTQSWRWGQAETGQKRTAG